MSSTEDEKEAVAVDTPAQAAMATEPPSPSTAPPATTPSGRPKRITPWNLKRRGGKVSDELADRMRTIRPKAQLCVDNISVSFDGFQAIKDLTLILDEGELRCIIGPNGAGKTTFMDIVTGKTHPDQGHVFFMHDCEDLIGLPEHEIARRGIGRKFQRPTVFPNHTVRENLELAFSSNKGMWRSLIHRFTKEESERINQVLDIIHLAEVESFRAGGLSHGQKQWLEIGMLLAQDPKVLLVDEPIAGMTHQEIERTAELLRSLAGSHTVVVIEHDMDFVRSIATDTVTVLHEGQILAEGAMDKVQNDPKVVEVYLGE